MGPSSECLQDSKINNFIGCKNGSLILKEFCTTYFRYLKFLLLRSKLQASQKRTLCSFRLFSFKQEKKEYKRSTLFFSLEVKPFLSFLFSSNFFCFPLHNFSRHSFSLLSKLKASNVSTRFNSFISRNKNFR